MEAKPYPNYKARRRVVLGVLGILGTILLVPCCGEFGSQAAFPVGSRPIHCAAFFPDGRRILYVHGDNSLRACDTETHEELCRVDGRSSTEIVSLAVSPDGHRAVSTNNRLGETSEVVVWDMDTRSILQRLRGPGRRVTSVAFTPDSRGIIAGSADGTLHLWDADSGETLSVCQGHSAEVNAVAVTPDGRQALTAAGDYSGSILHDPTVRVWDLASGEELRRYESHVGAVNCVAVSPDGRLVASGDSDDTVRIWEMETGREVSAMEGIPGPVRTRFNSVAFSRDGRKILTGTGDSVIGDFCLWDVATGQQVRRFVGHTARVWTVAFSPDGRRALSASGTWATRGYGLFGIHFGPWDDVDCTVRVWEVETGQELCRFE